MALDDIWDEPLAPPPNPAQTASPSPQKRPRPPLFLSDSDSDYERPPKRATPAPAPAPATTTRQPDVDALFADLDAEDDEDEDLRYKPLGPALDLDRLAKEAETRHARARQGAPSETQAGSSKTGAAGGADENWAKDKEKADDGEKKGRKVLPKLDEERLVGPDGFPSLVKEIEGFAPKGKGNEHTDLNRLLQIYQFWTHRMYPKTSFKDTVSRVEKLCHSKRMQVRLSVWRDEFKGLTNGKKLDDDSDVIDLTEPTLVADDGDEDDEEPEITQLKTERASSHTPSHPPASSEIELDDFDIDAVIRAEEERLATLRTVTDSSGSPRASGSATLAEKPSSASVPEANAMDVDEASLWEAFDDPAPLFDMSQSGPPSSIPPDDEDMWNILDEMEQRRPPTTTAKTQIPTSGVNLIPSLETTSTANVSRATNDEDLDEMYS